MTRKEGLVPDTSNGSFRYLMENDGYYVDDEDVEEFDRSFPHKEKLKLPGQIF